MGGGFYGGAQQNPFSMYSQRPMYGQYGQQQGQWSNPYWRPQQIQQPMPQQQPQGANLQGRPVSAPPTVAQQYQLMLQQQQALAAQQQALQQAQAPDTTSYGGT